MNWITRLCRRPTLVDFEFNEGSGTKVTDSVNSLVGTPGVPSNPPTFTTDSPSGQPGDTAIQFASGQYFTVNDPSTVIQFDTNNPSFTIEAWVKFAGTPAGRMVLFYSNGKGGAVSFSVNTDRTIFVTTLGILDQTSTAAIPDDGAWHHIAVIHQNGVQFTFYVDGVLLDTEPYTGSVILNRSTAQTLFSIGAEWNGFLQYVGELDRLKVFSGMLPLEQLDTNAVPPVGAAALTFASPTATPLGFSITVNEAGGSVADTNTISLVLNGASVTPSAVTQSRTTTTISFTLPGAPFPSGSTNTVSLAIKDTKGASYTNAASFVVGTYATLPVSAALPNSAVNATNTGFKIKTYQIDGPSTNGTVGTIAYNEDLLAGQDGPNVATIPDLVFGDVDTNGYFTWAGLINFDANPSGTDGYFNAPDYPDFSFPGIPGMTVNGLPNDNFVEEILAALDFKTPGMYSMAVVTDWTGFPDADDGFQVRAGANPKDPSSSVVLGFFDAAAPAGPTRGVADSPFQFYVPKAGSYPFRLLYYRTTSTAAGSAAQLEWYMLNADGTRSLINDTTNAITAYYQWTTPTARPTVSVARAAGGITLTFTGTLQSASSLLGPWNDLPGTSPLTVAVPPGATRQFYRTKQ